jgi:putative DNA primase/helicase
MNKQMFGRNVRAAVPAVRVARPREGEDRHRVYGGIALRPK